LDLQTSNTALTVSIAALECSVAVAIRTSFRALGSAQPTAASAADRKAEGRGEQLELSHLTDIPHMSAAEG
jgi:hypothetical protein